MIRRRLHPVSRLGYSLAFVAAGYAFAAPAVAEAPRSEVAVRAGYRWGLPANLPLTGVTYGQALGDWLTLRAGVEFGGVEAVTAANPANTTAGGPNSNPPVPTPIAYSGLSLALLSHTSPYVGVGASVSQAFYNFAATNYGPPNMSEYQQALEGIVGCRYAIAPIVLGAEYRLATDRTGTLTLSAGGQF